MRKKLAFAVGAMIEGQTPNTVELANLLPLETDRQIRNPSSLYKLACPFLCLLLAATPAHAGGDDREYRMRGDYWEGTKTKPVSAEYGLFGLVLIAAQAKASPAIDNASEQFHARFFLNKPQPVYLMVQERVHLNNYLLDKVQPTKLWQAGFNNDFAWPTAQVIDKLNLHLGDLVAIARLNGDKPSEEETVAPVLLYSTPSPPKTVDGYVFSFYSLDAVKLSWQVQEKCNGKPIFKPKELGYKLGGSVFDVDWSAANVRTGEYCLVVEGQRWGNNHSAVRQTVIFYHQPVIR